MLTDEEADAVYNEAFAVLHEILTDPAATEQQKKLARDQRDELTMRFIGQTMASVTARTQRFREFIDEMNALIAEFSRSTTVAGIVQLQAVVDQAAGLVTAATGAGAVPVKRAMRGKRPAKAKGKRKPAPARGAAPKRTGKTPGVRTTRAAAPKKPARKASRAPRKTSRRKAS
jgi:hypothetical protein